MGNLFFQTAHFSSSSLYGLGHHWLLRFIFPRFNLAFLGSSGASGTFGCPWSWLLGPDLPSLGLPPFSFTAFTTFTSSSKLRCSPRCELRCSGASRARHTNLPSFCVFFGAASDREPQKSWSCLKLVITFATFFTKQRKEKRDFGQS